MSLLLFSRRLWVPGLARKGVRFPDGVRHWLREGGWSLNGGLTNKKAEVVLHTLDDFVDATLCDAVRLASAAFESAKSVRPFTDEPKRCAWQFVSYYYAGFFAANALMRLTGHGCFNFSIGDCTEINEQARICNLGGVTEKTKLTPGAYYSHINLSGTPYWQISSVGSKGGVHIQFWTAFLKFLEALESEIKASSKTGAVPKNDCDAAKAELGDLLVGLKHSGVQTGAWLSEVRNALNYRLEYGAWFPYDDSVIDAAQMRSSLLGTFSAGGALPKSSETLPDPIRAVRITGFLLSWLRDSFATLASSSAGKSKERITKRVLELSASL